jgi:ubiquinone/menaquinone biosynthesis C-methylase UbiE
MRRPEFIAKQSRCPDGILGSVVARIMAHETEADNRAALDLLEIRADDHVLEIGFAHGRTIAAAAVQASHGWVAGVEISDRMLRMATHFSKKYIDERRMDLRLTDGRNLPFDDSRFDKVYTVHTLYFWPEPLTYVREIARVLKPDGRFVLGFRPADDPEIRNFPATVYRFYTAAEVAALLCDVGFTRIYMMPPRGNCEKMVFAVCEAPQKDGTLAGEGAGTVILKNHGA